MSPVSPVTFSATTAAQARPASLAGIAAPGRQCRDASQPGATDTAQGPADFQDRGGHWLARCPAALALCIQNGTG